MTGGFITLHRKAIDSWLWDLPAPQFKVAMTLLVMANWKPGSTFSGGELVEVARGQVMSSLPAISAKSGVSVQTVRTALKNLEKAGFLTDRSTARFRILTILNYAKYQDVSDDEQQAHQQAANSSPTAHQQAANSSPTAIEPSNQLTREPGNPHGASRPAAKSKQAHQLPESWEPIDSHRAKAKELCVDLAEQADEFRLHARGNGRVQKDWNAAFHLWLRRSVRYGATKTNTRPAKQGLSAGEIWSMADAMEEEENEQTAGNALSFHFDG